MRQRSSSGWFACLQFVSSRCRARSRRPLLHPGAAAHPAGSRSFRTEVSERMTLDAFHDRLSRYRETTLAGLLSAVPQREPQRYLYEPVTSYLMRIGKSIRPALCIATCEAFGGDP